MRIVPALQPIINVCTDQVMGYEILARWWDGQQVYRPDDVNLPWHEIDQLMLGEMLRYIGAMNKVSSRLFINVSADTMKSDRYWNLWIAKLNQLIFAATYALTIEIVESVDDSVLRKRWQDITAMGLSVALDDFGQQHATLDRLYAFPWNYCKLESTTMNSRVCKEAIHYCKRKNIHLIAEKIESALEAEYARDNGMNDQQGYHHGMPLLLTETFTLWSA